MLLGICQARYTAFLNDSRLAARIAGKHASAPHTQSPCSYSFPYIPPHDRSRWPACKLRRNRPPASGCGVSPGLFWQSGVPFVGDEPRSPGRGGEWLPARIERESLCRGLSSSGNLRLPALIAVTKAIGSTLTVETAQATQRERGNAASSGFHSAPFRLRCCGGRVCTR